MVRYLRDNFYQPRGLQPQDLIIPDFRARPPALAYVDFTAFTSGQYKSLW